MRLARSCSSVLLMAALTLISNTGVAQAGVVIYSASDAGAGPTDPRPNSIAAAASFDAAAAALGPLSLITFESAPLGSFSNLTVAPGVTIDGTDSLGAHHTIRNTPEGTPASIYGYNTSPGGSQFVYERGNVLTFSFDQSVRAFGAYISGIQFSGESITFNDGTIQTVTIPTLGISDGGIAFVGFTDDGRQISSITINAIGSGGPDFLGIDDVRFVSAVASAVPEPSTLVLAFTFGPAGLLALVRRKRMVA